MAYLNFNKDELVNLEYSLHREFLATNRAGGYLSSTIVCCNTRKYHGLLIVPVDALGGGNYVLLSSLDETIIQHGHAFNLAVHRWPGSFEPRGHKYIVDFEYEPIYSITYRVGGVILKKEIILVHNEDQVLIRYTLLDAHSETTLRLKPFMAFREVHKLTKANMDANTKYGVVENGISSQMYENFPHLNMQLSKKNEFIPSPDWYNNVEYLEEKERGYDYQEDLFTPGYFECPIKKGESIIFSASVEPVKTLRLKSKFQQLLEARSPRDNATHCLRYSASQFIVRRGKDTKIVAGYPWFGAWGRDTFIALPGVTIYATPTAVRDTKVCKDVLDTMLRYERGGLFPNVGEAYNTVDASMWFFKAMQEYGKVLKNNKEIWRDYGEKMKEILYAFRNGINQYIGMRPNGLIWAKEPGRALTWMDAVVNGEPVTQRGGFDVEVNALWYNAVCYMLHLADENGDEAFIRDWAHIAELIKSSFIETFWDHEAGYLADYVDENGRNMFVRPNQIFACSLEYSPLSSEQKHAVIALVKKDLLTPKGLRTLSPKNPNYKGFYHGDQETRDAAYHQGTVWPWLIGPYMEAQFRLHGVRFLDKAKEIMLGFQEDMTDYGLCSLPEVFDGNPPHKPNGCISQAWSVGEVLRMKALIVDYGRKKQ